MQLQLTGNAQTLEGLGSIDPTDPVALNALPSSKLEATLRGLSAAQWSELFARWAQLEQGVSGFSLKKLVSGVGKVLGGVVGIAAPIIGGAVGGPVGLAIGQTVGQVIGSVAGGGQVVQQPAPMTIQQQSTGGGIDSKTLLMIGAGFLVLVMLKRRRR